VGGFGISGTGNFTLYSAEQSVLDWWMQSDDNIDIRVRGRGFDAGSWDEINYTGVWVEIDDPVAEINISDCSVLDSAGTIYFLNTSIIDSDTVVCMNISANNVTLDCQGYTIDGIDTSTSRGIDIKRASAVTTNITIANCNITDWGYALYITSGDNNRIVNTTIGSNIYGSISILLSSGNNITNVTTKSNPVGFYLSGSNNNILSNNIDNSSDIGFDLDDSQNTTMTNNRMINTPRSGKQGLRILCTTVAKCRENISENNTINDIPILYVDGIIKLCPNNIIYTNGSSYGYMGFVGCNNITVTNSSPTNGIAFAGITNSTISNLNMSYSKRPFIIMAVSKYNNIINNTISNNDVSGILLYYSSNNVFINNTLHSNKPYSVYSNSGYNDTFIGGSVAMTTAGNFDYWLRNGGSNNTFTSTNMTTLRNIYLNEITTYFIYNDAIDGNIQLKTNILTAAKTIYRKVNNWTQSNISWDESASAALTANYSITNLYPNRAYDIYNFSQLAYTITTSSTGTLNFTINLNTTSRTIQVNGTAATDTCTCPTSGDWTINCADNCVITDACDMKGNNVTMNGAGTVIVASGAIFNWTSRMLSGGCHRITN
jgi:parallel beta-helix repeat protein